VIGIIGGTGPQGRGLAFRLAAAGVDVLVGSRSAERGEQVAREVAAAGVPGRLEGAANGDLPRRTDALLVAVPYDGLADTLKPMAGDVDGHVVMSAVNHLGFAGGPHALAVPAGSSANEVADLLPGGRVVTAFNNVSANHLLDAGHTFDEDVLVCGDDADAVATTVALVDRIPGLRGVAAGRLVHAATVEAMTALIIAVNKAHRVTAGVRITGL
jgi:8-hydroxy-5-deazaflavin:NADPH oxidoreductase